MTGGGSGSVEPECALLPLKEAPPAEVEVLELGGIGRGARAGSARALSQHAGRRMQQIVITQFLEGFNKVRDERNVAVLRAKGMQ